MPTYEYECTHCGHKFELLQKMSDKAQSECPKCRKKAKRLISSGAGLIFKGSGFYATDYRKKSKDSGPRGNAANACPHAQEKGCDGCPKA